MDLSILQLNAQGSKEVASDLRKHLENFIDIMIPYSLAGKVKGYAKLRESLSTEIGCPKVCNRGKQP